MEKHPQDGGEGVCPAHPPIPRHTDRTKIQRHSKNLSKYTAGYVGARIGSRNPHPQTLDVPQLLGHIFKQCCRGAESKLALGMDTDG